MAEPEIAPATGTGTEETVVETPEETPITGTPADDSADGEDEVLEADAAEVEAGTKTNVPYSRFKSVNERRKAAEARTAELEAKLAALTPKEEAKPTQPKDKLKRTLTPAPADMTPLEQMEYYGLQTLETHPEIFDAWFEKTFGIPADQAAATLAHATTTTRETIVAQFEKACEDRGLDPKNPSVQDAVGRLMDSKKYRNFGEAMDVFVKPKPSAPIQKKPATKGAESEGLALGGFSRVAVLPKTAKEAGILAAQGKAIEHVSVSDILRASMKT